jgi:hypothetical protein
MDERDPAYDYDGGWEEGIDTGEGLSDHLLGPVDPYNRKDHYTPHPRFATRPEMRWIKAEDPIENLPSGHVSNKPGVRRRPSNCSQPETRGERLARQKGHSRVTGITLKQAKGCPTWADQPLGTTAGSPGRRRERGRSSGRRNRRRQRPREAGERTAGRRRRPGANGRVWSSPCSGPAWNGRSETGCWPIRPARPDGTAWTCGPWEVATPPSPKASADPVPGRSPPPVNAPAPSSSRVVARASIHVDRRGDDPDLSRGGCHGHGRG